MSEQTHLSILLVVLVALTLLSIVGGFTTSPVMSIFGIVFLVCAIAVWARIREER